MTNRRTGILGKANAEVKRSDGEHILVVQRLGDRGLA
jgi:hypothetical protein